MLRTILDAGGSVRILSFGIRLPGVRYRVVPVHRRAFLFADAVIVKVLAGQAVGLFWSDAAARAKQVTALPWIRAKTSTLMALRGAIDLRELLAVVDTFTPASTLTGGIAGGTFAFRMGKVVLVHHLELRTGEDLLPVDVTHMAEVVIIEEANGASEDVAKRRHLEVLHFR